MNEFKVTVEIKGIGELVTAINRLAGHTDKLPANTVQTAGQPASGMTPPAYQQGQAPVQMHSACQQGQAPVQVPPALTQGQMQTQTPPVSVQGQQQPPVAPNVPTSAPVQGYTLEQLQVAAAGLMSAGRGPQVMGILQRFGIQAMTELPKERYGEFAMAIREAGAQI